MTTPRTVATFRGEQGAECLLKRLRLVLGPMAMVGGVDHHAGEEGAKRERDAEQLRRGDGDPQGYAQGRQREQLPRARSRHLVEEPGQDARAHQQHQQDEGNHLSQGQGQSRQS